MLDALDRENGSIERTPARSTDTGLNGLDEIVKPDGISKVVDENGVPWWCIRGRRRIPTTYGQIAKGLIKIYGSPPARETGLYVRIEKKALHRSISMVPAPSTQSPRRWTRQAGFSCFGGGCLTANKKPRIVSTFRAAIARPGKRTEPIHRLVLGLPFSKSRLGCNRARCLHRAA